MEINANISPALVPENVKAIEGYDQATGPYVNGVVEAFSTAYEGLKAVHAARAAAEKNPAWTPENRLIQTGQFAEKHLKAITRKFDAEMGRLGTAISATEQMLTAPISQSAASGPIAGEIRAFVKNLPLEKRHQFLMAAHEANDTQTLCACLGAPAYLSGMSNVERDTHTHLYHERANPDVAKRLKVMKAAKAMMEDRGGLVFKEMEKAVGAPAHKVTRLRAATADAEKAFILKDGL